MKFWLKLKKNVYSDLYTKYSHSKQIAETKAFKEANLIIPTCVWKANQKPTVSKAYDRKTS